MKKNSCECKNEIYALLMFVVTYCVIELRPNLFQNMCVHSMMKREFLMYRSRKGSPSDIILWCFETGGLPTSSPGDVITDASQKMFVVTFYYDVNWWDEEAFLIIPPGGRSFSWNYLSEVLLWLFYGILTDKKFILIYAFIFIYVQFQVLMF